MRRLILASGSPRRKELLESAGLTFEVVRADVEEWEWAGEAPRVLAEMNARLKAHAVSRSYPDQVVLGADTVVVLDGEVFGKPADLEQARSMLDRLSGRVHQVITGVCLRCSADEKECLFSDFTQVRFRSVGKEAITEYLDRIDPLDKAGAYAAQEDEGALIDRIEGSLTNVIGLPMERLQQALAQHFPFFVQPG